MKTAKRLSAPLILLLFALIMLPLSASAGTVTPDPINTASPNPANYIIGSAPTLDIFFDVQADYNFTEIKIMAGTQYIPLDSQYYTVATLDGIHKITFMTSYLDNNNANTQVRMLATFEVGTGGTTGAPPIEINFTVNITKMNTITFDLNGGSNPMSPITATNGTQITLPECTITPPNPNLQFSLWNYTNDNNVAEQLNNQEQINLVSDMVLIPQWEDIPFVIKYHANGGGTGTMEDGSGIFGQSVTIKNNEFTPMQGQQFVGWAIGSTTGTQIPGGGTRTFNYDTTPSTENIIDLYAIWQEIPDPIASFELRYDANGGTGYMDDQGAVYGEATTLKQNGFTAPEGQRFVAWAVGSVSGTRVNAGATYTFIENPENDNIETVYSIWEDIQEPVPSFELRYDANGGTGTMEDQGAVYGKPTTLKQNGFTAPEGKKFVAWAVSSVGGTRVNAGATYTFMENPENDNIETVYAIWEDIEEPATPETGDNSNLIATITLMLISLSAVAVVYINRKRLFNI